MQVKNVLQVEFRAFNPPFSVFIEYLFNVFSNNIFLKYDIRHLSKGVFKSFNRSMITRNSAAVHIDNVLIAIIPVLFLYIMFVISRPKDGWMNIVLNMRTTVDNQDHATSVCLFTYYIS